MQIMPLTGAFVVVSEMGVHPSADRCVLIANINTAAVISGVT